MFGAGSVGINKSSAAGIGASAPAPAVVSISASSAAALKVANAAAARYAAFWAKTETCASIVSQAAREISEATAVIGEAVIRVASVLDRTNQVKDCVNRAFIQIDYVRSSEIPDAFSIFTKEVIAAQKAIEVADKISHDAFSSSHKVIQAFYCVKRFMACAEVAFNRFYENLEVREAAITKAGLIAKERVENLQARYIALVSSGSEPDLVEEAKVMVNDACVDYQDSTARLAADNIRIRSFRESITADFDKIRLDFSRAEADHKKAFIDCESTYRARVEAWSKFDSIAAIPGVVFIADDGDNFLDYAKASRSVSLGEFQTLFQITGDIEALATRVAALPKVVSFADREAMLIDSGINVAAAGRIHDIAHKASGNAKETFEVAKRALHGEAIFKAIYFENKITDSASACFDRLRRAVQFILEADMAAVKAADRAVIFARASKAIVAPLIEHAARIRGR